jgi:hypothetical protein
MPDLEKQHDELRAAITRAREEWWAAQSQERNAYARLQEAQRRLIEFDKRNEVIREDD